MEQFDVTQKPVELDNIHNYKQTIRTKCVICINDKMSQLNYSIWINTKPKIQKKTSV